MGKEGEQESNITAFFPSGVNIDIFFHPTNTYLITIAMQYSFQCMNSHITDYTNHVKVTFLYEDTTWKSTKVWNKSG